MGVNRILFANPVAALGGAELFLLEMLEELRELAPEWELHLVCGADGPLLQRASSLGVTCHIMPFPPAFARLGDSALCNGTRSRISHKLGMAIRLARSVCGVWTYSRRLKKLIARIQPLLVQSNGLKFHILMALCMAKTAKLVWFMHDFPSSRPVARLLVAKLAHRASLILANSKSVAQDCRKLVPTGRVEVVYCGLNLSQFSPGPSEGQWLDALAGSRLTTAGKLRVGLVATYARWKGQDIFLRAAADLVARSEVLNVHFYIIGGPIYDTAGSQYSRSELEGLAKSLDITDAVSFVPFQEDVARVFRSLDVVVHASRVPEPFGRTILEAMACERPVIATAAGGAAEIITPGHDAIGVPPGSVSALRDAICECARNTRFRHSLASNARARASCFSRRRMGLALYRSLSEQILPGSEPSAAALP